MLALVMAMQLGFKHQGLPQPAWFESWLSDLNHLGSAAWTTLRVWPAPFRDIALAKVRRQPPNITLLITDLVDFSNLVTTLGDRAAHKVIQKHNSLLRGCLRQYAGREVAHTGDGIIASFGESLLATRCAVCIQDSLRGYRMQAPKTPLNARIGLHSGHPLREEGRLFGACVNFAVRVCSAATADEILISDCVRSAIDAHFECLERPPVRLKGFEGSHRLHAVVGDDARHCCGSAP